LVYLQYSLKNLIQSQVWWLKPIILDRHQKDHGSRPAQAKSFWDLISTNGCARRCTPVIPIYVRSTNKMVVIQACLDIKQDPWDLILKITNAKRARSVAQKVHCLPSKCETLSSTLRTDKQKCFNFSFTCISSFLQPPHLAHNLLFLIFFVSPQCKCFFKSS
jgi:hypothetical protein